ncbi:MAG: hypothetical protein LBJ13_02965 [Puniceicoccales bacterium]|nr:hypothetical protein [Puniceicoccales bacterium]
MNVPKLAFAAEGPAPKFTPRPTPKANSTPKPKTPAAKPKTEKAPKAEAPKQQRVVPTREMQNACWDKLKQSGEWSHSKGHSKPTLENKKTGQFLQKSIEKWELEAFDKHENHIGIMRPNEPGIIRTEFSVRGRKMGK